ncbi:MAG: exodeoxyribonuclease VII large subunit [Coxiella sp. (in: Bacteria)]|nr:MAG: exodeoxyribonuclease VII large subunit [Coxiella sp. (in: g-proteobacteria)]
MQNIYTIAELNSKARLLLENEFGTVSIIGEISNLARPASGHLYFTLKDQQAQVRCALFRMNRRNIDFPIDNGQQVLAQAKVSLYEGRGDYQLIVSRLQLAGDGALQVAFEKLKEKLEKEGLFDATHKKPLPRFPQCIGVITSASGAAVRDILKVLKRRSPTTPVIIYPSLVQGASAKQQLVHAIETANRRNECDVLILSRGGGSLEDLWPFNEECVARAIYNSHIPIVSGVGHEVDTTIADYVADHRAATPSAAAETISLDQAELYRQLDQLKQRLSRHTQQHLLQWQQQVTHLQKRLRHPRDKLREQAQHLDQLEQTLSYCMNNKLNQAKIQLQQHYPALMHTMQLLKNKKQEQLTTLSHQLNALSPLATLQRGYAVLTDNNDKLIRSVQSVQKNESLTAKLHDGHLTCIVTNIT